MIKSVLVGMVIGFIWWYRKHPIPRFGKVQTEETNLEDEQRKKKHEIFEPCSYSVTKALATYRISEQDLKDEQKLLQKVLDQCGYVVTPDLTTHKFIEKNVRTHEKHSV